MSYDYQAIEAKWKKYWSENDIYKVSNDTSKPKYYVLDMFPYPSGSGLHVGHPLGYIASDIYSRYKRMSGFNVLHPMGFDSFGLPAEQYAIQMGVHPSESTAKNISYYKSQLENLGVDYDWSRSVTTSDPGFYKWTQWIFILLFNHYYDTRESKAKRIEDLVKIFEQKGTEELEAFRAGDHNFSATDWNSYSNVEKADILMNYRLAYRKIGYVNWCEALGTVLANDEVKDGVSERGGYPVVKKAMLQWSLRITAYAERLLNDLNKVDWSDSLKIMQKNWIGRSEGAQVFFSISQGDEQIEIFTTRPDTIYGATFMVLAPEHELVTDLSTPDQRDEIQNYINYAKTRSDIDRMSDAKDVTGCFTGSYAINPFTNKQIPIWISDYVLKDYGTGAIMAVPSDDERDLKFAEKFHLDIVTVVDKSGFPEAGIHDKVGTIVNSPLIDGMSVIDAISKIIEEIESRQIGQRMINYKLRDANFSRQRYWGEPFPVYYTQDGMAHTLLEGDLPLELPPLTDFKPTKDGKSPIAKLESWLHPESGITRETDTMPGYAGSSWYFLRYMDANNDKEFASKEALQYWQDVDLYIGGTEHAVGHLMYSRFWHKFLYDLNLVPSQEPFKRLVNQGMIQGIIEYIYLQKEKVNGLSRFLCSGLRKQETDKEFVTIPVQIDFIEDYGSAMSFMTSKNIKQFIELRPEFKDAIFECSKGVFQNGKFTPTKEGVSSNHLYTHSEVGKMSKRYYNTVNPNTIIDKYGADNFRMYEMFLGPIEQSKPWNTNGIEGISKFSRKFWSLFHSENGVFKVSSDPANEAELKLLHSTIKKVSEDVEKLSFNTAISAFMICTNELKKSECNKREILEPLVKLISPFAPFIADELWQLFGHSQSVHLSSYPIFNDKFLQEASVTYPLCVNGKKRSEITISAEADKDQIESAARNAEQLTKWLEGKEIKKVIVVPGRMINVVI